MTHEHHPKPIFYDERGRRWPALLRTWAAIGLVLSVLAGVFAVSVFFSPVLPRLKLPSVSFEADPRRPVLAGPKEQEQAKFAAARALDRNKTELARQIRATRLPVPAPRARAKDQKPLSIVAGFYVNWDPGSFSSLKSNADALTHLIPEWMHLGKDGASFRSEESGKVIKFCAQHKLPIVPLINNVDEGDWDPARLHALLISKPKQDRLIAAIIPYLQKNHFRGLNLDLENADAADRDRMTDFVRRLSRALHRNNLTISQDIELDNDAYDMSALGRIVDVVIPMLYDENDNTGTAGPIASQNWYQQQAAMVYQQVPPEKVVLGVGCYGYDWVHGQTGGKSIDYEAAVISARDNDARIVFDKASLNPRFSYEDEKGQAHDVWFLDAATVYNQLLPQRKQQPLGAALWMLGSEDPSLWTFFHRQRLAQPANPMALRSIAFTQEVDTEGKGEILHVDDAVPTDGLRTIVTDKNGLIRDEKYVQFPATYVLRQYGGDDGKTLCLTFDDGPDPQWTPQILDILHRYHVPATFFVIGSHAEEYPGIIKREYDEGHEIGNHTYNHPDISQVGDLRVRLELDATQRAIETITGHSTVLFRAPYTVDTAPEKADQIKPLVEVSRMGYVTVGANVDPNDWAEPGVAAILHGSNHPVLRAPGVKDVDTIDGVLPTIAAGQLPNGDPSHIILLHDAGGDRADTVKALPIIIESLQKQGYRFATISGLMGHANRNQEMPAISGRQAVLVGADKVWFNIVYGAARLLQTLFYFALALGITRVLFTMVFALVQNRQNRDERFNPLYRPSVSVVIAAFNEAAVIERTVRTILDGDYPDVDVIVVDDGSTDDTAAVVRRAFGSDPRVYLQRKENGGKAGALNMGIEEARGEIVIGLDADTMFAPDTISLMVRHFHDPGVAAVAGNVKVGNRVNLWTIWQSLEYITSQNFDRRAYSALNCITVVPGAVGAWRKSVVEEAGGYLSDTLAEDTDLTLRVRRLGYRIKTENDALAFTEAPDNAKSLAKQRFRWAFGTLQCLWKHHDVLFNREYGTLGTVALPTLWLFQIVFQAISPIVDLTILFAALRGNLGTVLWYYAIFFLVDLAGGLVAVVLDKEDWRLLLWMFWQRFVYRQLMYYVVGRSVLAAFRGHHVGWGKLQRKGTATVAGAR